MGNAAHSTLDMHNQYKEDLADIFIVSQAVLVLKEGAADQSIEDAAENIAVSVVRSEGEKCERCWKYFTVTQGSNQSVCGRCGEALKSYDAAE